MKVLFCTIKKLFYWFRVFLLILVLQIRGTLKSWTKLWCVLKPGVLLIYKTPKTGQWVGTILLHSCELIERPSKKDGFCFKLFHPLDQSIWAVKVRRTLIWTVYIRLPCRKLEGLHQHAQKLLTAIEVPSSLGIATNLFNDPILWGVVYMCPTNNKIR